MHTPDSRIAHDWHLDALPGPESTSLPPGGPTRAQAGHLVGQMTPELRDEMEAYWASAEPIDTSTTAGKISVMQQAHDDGRNVQYRFKKKEMGWEFVGGRPLWDWDTTDYRIAPPPAPISALQGARDAIRHGDKPRNPDSLALEALVNQIDNSIVVTIEPFKFPHYGATKPEDLQPGRYRLLRDDA